MLLTEEEKKHLLKVLGRDQLSVFRSNKEREKSKQLHDKIKQTLRNEAINKDHK
ncbi:hypothetical protein [Alteribacillus bidgolensis]|uniref:50S ribosomal protein L29 n=1 Tax=Alteribacillus bidgolensis TaxID=930129 RepID=A0A1G8M5Q0_9BACI|nr:hypothetical protein [Alteribacillus bidgolensis]SDI63241.1 hypothetical protein SAMN05216352_109222 [Alteribacillus bidgolensis]